MDRRRFLQSAGFVALAAPALAAVEPAGASKSPKSHGGQRPHVSGLTTVNMSPANFPNWRKAVAGVKARKSSSKVLFVGTSITLGAGVGLKFPTQSVPAYFAQYANTSIAAADQSLGALSPNTPDDSRFTVGSGWFAEGGGAGLGWANVGYIAGNPGAGNLTFTPAPSQKVDTFDIWYIGGPKSGSMAARVNGGKTTKINTTMKGGTGIAKVTIKGKAGTSNVLTLHSVTKGSVFLFAIDAYLSTETALRVGNAGISGLGTALNWATASAGSSLACIRAYSPGLTVIALGGDDALLTGPPTSVPAFTTAVQSVITAAKLSGDVLLWTEPLSVTGGLVSVPDEQAYATAFYGLASANNVGLVDIGALFVSGAAARANGLLYDQYHPNQAGNIDIANALVQALGSVL